MERKVNNVFCLTWINSNEWYNKGMAKEEAKLAYITRAQSLVETYGLAWSFLSIYKLSKIY